MFLVTGVLSGDHLSKGLLLVALSDNDMNNVMSLVNKQGEIIQQFSWDCRPFIVRNVADTYLEYVQI